jgi:hypothetical protein
MKHVLPDLVLVEMHDALRSDRRTVPYTAQGGEQPPPSSASAVTKGLDLVRRARQARVAGRLADAAVALEAALSSESADQMTVRERAEALGELGLCKLAQRKYRDAAEHVYKSLDHWTDLRPPFRLELQNAYNEAVKHIGRVYFAISPPETAVLLDGRPIGRVTKSVVFFVEPGRHTVRSRLNGYKESSQSFDIEGTQRHMVTLDLPRATEAVEREKVAGRESEKESVVDRQNAINSRRATKVTSEPPPSAASKVRLVGAVLTGTTAVASGAFFLWAAITDSEINARSDALDRRNWDTSACIDASNKPECHEIRDAFGRMDTLNTMGWVALATSGTLGVLTLGSLLLDRAPSTKETVRIAPIATSRDLGLFIHGEF